jgi:hypothetical protein
VCACLFVILGEINVYYAESERFNITNSMLIPGVAHSMLAKRDFFYILSVVPGVAHAMLAERDFYISYL